MDPGIASFEPRTPNVRPAPDFWEVGFHDSVSPARPSITQIEPDMREREGGEEEESLLFSRLQITTGNGDNKIRKDTALITKQHENEQRAFLGKPVSIRL